MAQSNYDVFRDCLASTFAQHREAAIGHEKQPRRRAKKTKLHNKTTQPESDDKLSVQNNDDELTEFIDYVASELFDALPDDLQHLEYRTWRDSPDLQEQFSLPLTDESIDCLNLPPSISDTLCTYGLIASDPTLPSLLPSSATVFLLPAFTTYLEYVTRPPPASVATRKDACEICERFWVPLTYHHLIPRFVHDKAVKRGWHKPEDLGNVAWLCSPCHSFVHRFATHEDLARYYHTVELLLEQDEVQKWVSWAGRLRWKAGKNANRTK